MYACTFPTVFTAGLVIPRLPASKATRAWMNPKFWALKLSKVVLNETKAPTMLAAAAFSTPWSVTQTADAFVVMLLTTHFRVVTLPPAMKRPRTPPIIVRMSAVTLQSGPTKTFARPPQFSASMVWPVAAILLRDRAAGP